jgi:hypothetical protein
VCPSRSRQGWLPGFWTWARPRSRKPSRLWRALGADGELRELREVEARDPAPVAEGEGGLVRRLGGKLPQAQRALRAGAAQNSDAGGSFTESDQLTEQGVGWIARPWWNDHADRRRTRPVHGTDSDLLEGCRDVRSVTGVLEQGHRAVERDQDQGFEIGPPSGSELDHDICDLRADRRRRSLEERGANGHEVNEGAPPMDLGQGDQGGLSGRARDRRCDREGGDYARVARQRPRSSDAPRVEWPLRRLRRRYVNGDGIGIELENVRVRWFSERGQDLRGHAEGESAPLGVFQLFKCASCRESNRLPQSRNPWGASSSYGALCRPGDPDEISVDRRAHLLETGPYSVRNSVRVPGC